MSDNLIPEQPIEETLEPASAIFKSRQERILVRKKIRNFSYYSMPYGLSLKPVVDRMIADKKPRTFKASTHRKSLRTLYIMMTRSLYYLADFMDTSDNTYESFQRQTLWQQDERAGILTLRYKGPGEEDVKMPTTSKPWKIPFDTFIEEGESGTEINIEGLRLEQDDLDYIAGSLLGMNEIVKVAELNKTTIRMRRL
jgi:hypothetical protein